MQNSEAILPFSCCPLVFLFSQNKGAGCKALCWSGEQHSDRIVPGVARNSPANFLMFPGKVCLCVSFLLQGRQHINNFDPHLLHNPKKLFMSLGFCPRLTTPTPLYFGDIFGVSLGGTQALLSFWKVPGSSSATSPKLLSLWTLRSGEPKRVVSKRVVLADVPPERKPERGYVRQNHPFRNRPFTSQ